MGLATVLSLAASARMHTWYIFAESPKSAIFACNKPASVCFSKTTNDSISIQASKSYYLGS